MSTEKQISNKNNNIKCSTCLKIIQTSLLRDPSLEYGFILWWSKIAMEQIGTGPMFVLGTPLCTTCKWVAANAVPGGLCVFVTFWVLYVYIYIWGGVGWDINVLTTTSLILRCHRMFHQLGKELGKLCKEQMCKERGKLCKWRAWMWKMTLTPPPTGHPAWPGYFSMAIVDFPEGTCMLDFGTAA